VINVLYLELYACCL